MGIFSEHANGTLSDEEFNYYAKLECMEDYDYEEDDDEDDE